MGQVWPESRDKGHRRAFVLIAETQKLFKFLKTKENSVLSDKLNNFPDHHCVIIFLYN
jgi:hypothetical protein